MGDVIFSPRYTNNFAPCRENHESNNKLILVNIKRLKSELNEIN